MKNERKPKIETPRDYCAAVVVLLMGLFMTSVVQAQGWPVIDVAHTNATYMGWMKQGDEYVKQAERWKKERDHYEQQLADAQKFFQSQGVSMTLDFEERSLNYGINENCPGSKKGPANADNAVSNAVNTMSSWHPLNLDGSNNLKKEMLDLCEQIVVTQNKKYNEIVKLLKNVKQRDDELQELDGYRQGVGTSQGKLATSSNQLSAFAARTQTDIEYARTVIATYNERIDSLKQDQAIVSQRILEGGSKTLVSGLLQGAAIKGAFAVLKSRDR